jgi:hypothetical protein
LSRKWHITATAAAALCASASIYVAVAAAQSGGAVLYGDSFLLSGDVEQNGAGVVVVVLARPHGSGRFREVARVRTTSGGTWRYNARPAIRTVYRARADDVLSEPVVVDVEPRVVLRGTRGRFTASVRAARSFAGRFVLLQRRRGGPWVSAQRLVLDRRSSTRFVFVPPVGRTEIRLLMPRSQVGPGYVAGRSDIIRLTVR